MNQKKKTRKKEILLMLFAWLIYAILEAFLFWLNFIFPSADDSQFEQTKLKNKKAYSASIIIGTAVLILVAFALAIAIKAYLYPQPTQYQYLSANIFPLHANLYGYQNYNYTFYPQLQTNGTACIQYISYKTPNTFNYTTQKEDTITTYNATQITQIYNEFASSMLSNSGNQIQIQTSKTLLCPDIVESR
ncbi:MAG: hypothetical protein QXS81_01165 [Candidatus Micrarchaeaceae archaeon]